MEWFRLFNCTKYHIDILIYAKFGNFDYAIRSIEPFAYKRVYEHTYSGLLNSNSPQYPHALDFDFERRVKFIHITEYDIEGCKLIIFIEVNGEIIMKRINEDGDVIVDCKNIIPVQKNGERSIQKIKEKFTFTERSIQENEKSSEKRFIQNNEERCILNKERSMPIPKEKLPRIWSKEFVIKLKRSGENIKKIFKRDRDPNLYQPLLD